MSALPAAWPPWLVICGLVAAAGIALWILSKVLRWVLWLVLLAVFAACAIVAVRMFFH